MLAPSYLQSIDLARLLSETPHKMLAQIQTPLFLSQLGGIVVSFVLAYWLSKRAHVFAAHWTAASAHKTWGKHLARLVDYIALPLSWLVLLWLGAVAAIAIDVPLHIVGAAIDLVFAWICIRLLSSTVSSNAAAIAISLVA